MWGLPSGPSVIACARDRFGLGNRMRLVLGAQTLAVAEQRQFGYVWPTTTFGPRLDQLWAFDAPVVPMSVSRVLALRYPYLNQTLSWLDDDRRRDRVWQIRTGHDLRLPAELPRWQDQLIAMRPVAEISARIRSVYTDELSDRPYVGVMIRAHAASHSQTLQHSPVQWYVNRMKELRTQHPDLHFFISSDVPEVAASVAAQLAGCTVQPNKGGYNTVAGVQAAVADLYLLACSQLILGPHFSSFPELAQFLAGGDLPLETAATQATGAFDPARRGRATDPLWPSVLS